MSTIITPQEVLSGVALDWCEPVVLQDTAVANKEPEPESDLQPSPSDWLQMSVQEKLARTTFVACTTHVRINGELQRVETLPTRFGFTYEEWRAATDRVKAARTYCVLSGVRVSLEEFEERHPHIQLGQE